MKKGSAQSMIAKIASFAMIAFFLVTPFLVVAETNRVTVGPHEIIDKNLIRAGEVIDVAGTINGDVVVAGKTITVSGKVQGDVIAAGQTVTIRGEIQGNVRVAGETVVIDGKIGKNVTSFSRLLEISNNNSIGWSTLFFSQDARVGGTIGGHLDGYAQEITLVGSVGGNASFETEQNHPVTLKPSAVIKGDLFYSGNVAPKQEPGSQIYGGLQSKSPQLSRVAGQNPSSLFGLSRIFWKITKLFALLVIGLVLLSLFKSFTLALSHRMTEKPLHSIGWGTLLLLGVPLGSIFLVMTLIGIPLALMLLALWFIALYLTKAVFGFFLGEQILTLFRKKNASSTSPLLCLFLGTSVFVLVTTIPIIGNLLGIIAVVWTLGTAATIIRS